MTWNNERGLTTKKRFSNFDGLFIEIIKFKVNYTLQVEKGFST